MLHSSGQVLLWTYHCGRFGLMAADTNFIHQIERRKREKRREEKRI